MNKTIVVFRIWPDGEVLALFPLLPATADGLYCTSYANMGQHSSADYNGCIRRTSPAKPSQYRALAEELKQRGYNLKVVKRCNWKQFKRVDA